MIAGNKDALLKLIGNYFGNLKEIIIWDKINAEPAINDNVLNSQYEFLLVFSENNKRKFDRCFSLTKKTRDATNAIGVWLSL